MPRLGLIVAVAFATASAGCVHQSGYHYTCPSEEHPSCGVPDELIVSAIALGVLAIAGGVYFAATERRVPPRSGAPPRARPLEGRVRWNGTGAGVASVTVTLRRTNDSVAPTATTDADGRFQFDFPVKPGWYTLAVDTTSVKGETTVWLQDRRPDNLEVRVQPPGTWPRPDQRRPGLPSSFDGVEKGR